MKEQKLPIIYEDDDLIVYDKPPGVNSDDFQLRVHRLDKDTSGILVVAKNDRVLEFLQRQFKERKVIKKYLALVAGHLKNDAGTIETLLGRAPGDRRKQKAYLQNEPRVADKRTAVTRYKLLQKFKDYDLIEVEPKTGRKHQIRAHLVYLGHPIAGDRLYAFKGQKNPDDLYRQFLHAYYLKLMLPGGKEREFRSGLPEELKEILKKIKQK